MAKAQNSNSFETVSTLKELESGERIGRSSRWPSGEISDWDQETIQRARSADSTKEVA